MRTIVLLTCAVVAGAADLPPEITALHGGVIVSVNAAQLDVLKPLAATGTWAVEAVLPDATSAWELRAKLAAEPAYGLLSVTDAAHGLPYHDRTATVTVVDRDAPGAPSEAEIDRITSPFGAVWERKAGAWSIRRSPMTKEWDEWHYHFRDTGGSCVSLDTIVGPASGMSWNDHREHLGKEGSPGYRLADGVAVSIESTIGPALKNDAGYSLVARDAFNGATLWRRPILKTNFGGINYFIHDGRLFATERGDQPMIAVQLRNGAVVKEYDQGLRAISAGPAHKLTPQVEAMVIKGLLVQSGARDLVGLDVATGAKRWAHQEAEGRWLHTLRVVDEQGLAYVVSSDKPVGRGRTTIDGASREIVAVDIATGKERWRWKLPEGFANTMAYDRGQLLSVGSGQWGASGSKGLKGVQQVTVLDAATGNVVWSKRAGENGEKSNTSLLGNNQNMYGIFLGDEVWTLGGGGGTMTAFKRSDGSFGRRFTDDVHGNCQRPLPTVNWMLGTALIRWSDLNWTRQSLGRSVCGAGIFPAYGRRYVTGNGCGCADFLRGVFSVWSGPLPTPVADEQRAERFAAVPAPRPAKSLWAMQQADAIRSGASAEALPATLNAAWQTPALPPPPAGLLTAGWEFSDLEGDKGGREGGLMPLSGAVIADDVVVVAERHRHQVVARDAATGKERWRFVAGGRIDQAPTLVDGLCVFGSRDGYVWALDLATGTPLWRHLIAPTPRRIFAHGQLEAASFVHGSVIPVGGGDVAAMAGRHPELDGGLHFVRLKRDGSAAWRSNDNLTMPLAPPAVGQRWLDERIKTSSGTINAWGATRSDPLLFNGKWLGTGNTFVDPATGKVERVFAKTPDGVTIPYHFKYGRPPSIWIHAQVQEQWEAVGRGFRPGWLVTLPDGRVAVHKGFTGGVPGKEALMIGGLALFPDRNAKTPTWNRGDAANGIATATLIAAGDELVLLGTAGFAKDAKPVLRRFAIADGAPRGEAPLPAAPAVYGVASAGGRLYVSDDAGRLHVLGAR